MRTMRVLFCAIALCATGSTWAATFTILSGQLHAQAEAGSNSDSPPDIVLGVQAPHGSVTASAQTIATSGTIYPGTFFSAGGVDDPTHASAGMGGSATGNSNGGIATDGGGSLDVIFALDQPARVKLDASGGQGFFTGNINVRDGNGITLQSFTADNLVTMDWNAGAYELSGSGSIHPTAGIGGSGGLHLEVSIVPEPAGFAMLGLAALLLKRQPRAKD